jgi:hypothetical protein
MIEVPIQHHTSCKENKKNEDLKIKEAIDSPETKDVTYLGYADDNCLAGEMGQAMKAVAVVDDKNLRQEPSLDDHG